MTLTEVNELLISKGDDASFSSFLYIGISGIEGKVLEKYRNVEHQYSVEVSDEDTNVLLTIKQEDYHILLKAYIDYLLASNKSTYSKSPFVSDVKKYVDFYKKNILSFKHYMQQHNLMTMLKWLRIKFPNDAVNIVLDLMKSIDKIDNKAKVKYVHLYNALFSWQLVDKEVYLETIKLIFNIYIHLNLDEDITGDIQALLYNVLKTFEKVKKKAPKELVKEYCDYVVVHTNSFTAFEIQKILREVRDYMDYVGSYDDSDYYTVDERLEKANQEVMSGLVPISAELPNKQKEQVNDYISLISDNYQRLSNVSKICYMLSYIEPFNLKTLKYSYEHPKSVFAGFVDEHILDSKGNLINYKKLTKEEDFSLKMRSEISIAVRVNLTFHYYPFVNLFTFDENVEKYIEKILTNNPLVHPSRIKILTRYISSFFKGDYLGSIFDLTEEFEGSLRYYFKSKKYNVKRTNSSNDLVGLPTMLRDKADNKFKKELLKTITEDYFFTLRWLLIDEYGFDLRDKAAHRTENEDIYNTEYAVFCALHIIRLYFGFGKCE